LSAGNLVPFQQAFADVVLGWVDIWLRVEPDNEPALRCYAAAGFVRASPDEEAAFNIAQPADYVWMRAPS
jgi:RimJ/RimL family protein N-acetyltransferase